MGNKEEKLQPRMRFRGFTDAWEKRYLGDYVVDYTEKTTQENQFPVLTSSQQQGIVLQSEYFSDRQVTTDENIGYFVLPRGYFTYRSRSDNNIFVFNRNDIIDKGIISYFYPVFGLINVDSNFFLRRINNGLNRQLAIAAEGTGQHVLSLKKFKKMETRFPSLPEQKQIGEFLECLDDLITVNQRKLDLLKEQKKGYLQKMFPKNGAKVPELRFAGFADDWEQRKFKDILKTHSFRSYLAGVSENGEYEVIQQGDKPIVGYSDGEPFTDYKDVTLFGDHTVSLYKPKSPFFVATDGVKILSADNFEGNYLYTTLERYKPEPQGYKRHFTILKNQDVWFTENMEEQQKIGSFFKQLDETIALHQHKLDLLKEQKKGFLQKMFV
jgi:type I restriction enzyme S subunit